MNEKGLFVATNNKKNVAYAMSASWHYWAEWPMFQFMLKELPNLKFMNKNITTENSYQYGPICIDRPFRGTGMLESVFDFAREQMSEQYPIMLTFINKNNPRSYEAHTRKLLMTTINEFEFNGNSYYELAYDTSKQLK